MSQFLGNLLEVLQSVIFCLRSPQKLVNICVSLPSMARPFQTPISFLQGLFHKAIGQSGSALSPWAFDKEPSRHARQFARTLNCDKESQDDIPKCLMTLSAENVTKAFEDFQVSLSEVHEQVYSKFAPSCFTQRL